MWRYPAACGWHVARAVVLHGVGELPKRSRKQRVNCKLSLRKLHFSLSDSTNGAILKKNAKFENFSQSQ
jgi:hypothetical protein